MNLCIVCSKPTKTKFCSLTCFYKNGGARKGHKSERITFKCEICEKERTILKSKTGNERFCSIKCSAIGRKGENTVERIRRKCKLPECENIVITTKSRNHEYCSNSCSAIGTDSSSRGLRTKVRFIKDLNHLVRSKLEEEVCRRLIQLNEPYNYEPISFIVILDGKITRYVPDLYLFNRDEYWEIKGYPKFEKYLAFKEQYPKIETKLIRNSKFSLIYKSG